MATFTMHFYEAIEALGGCIQEANGRTVLENPNSVGLEFYPIFNEGYRTLLNGLIVDRFMMREIGQETPQLFRLALRRKMNEIMGFYNRLYEADRIKFDPLKTIDMRTLTDTTSDAETTGAASQSDTTKSVAKALSNIYPQQAIQENGKQYADAGSRNETETTGGGSSENTGTTTGKDSADSRVSGYQGNPSLLLTDYRASLVNTDTLVLDNLDDCFMGILGNADSFTQPRQPWRFGL